MYDTGEERLHALVPAGHPIIEVREDGKVIPMGVDVFDRRADLVVLAVRLGEEVTGVVPKVVTDTDQTPRIGIHSFLCPAQLTFHQW